MKLIDTLYSPTTPPQIQQAIQAQLLQIQDSPESWSLISPILSNASYSTNSRFFIASVLKHKISSTVDDKQGRIEWSSLKQELLSWISLSSCLSYPAERSNQEPRIEERVVLRKLASAITSLSIRLYTEWNDWLLECIMRISGAGAARMAVLEVLAVCVEQVGRSQMLGTKRLVNPSGMSVVASYGGYKTNAIFQIRATYLGSLTSSIPLIVTTLSTSLSLTPTDASSIHEINASLTCFLSFLLSSQFNHSHLDELYPLILRHLYYPETRSKTINVLEELIERSSGLSETVGITKWFNRIKTYQLIKEWICSEEIQKMFEKTLTISEQEAEDLVEDEEFRSICRFVAVLTEHSIQFFFDDPQRSSTTTTTSTPLSTIPNLSIQTQQVQLLLSFSLKITFFPGHSLEVYKVNELTEGIWSSLQEECAEIGLVFGNGDGQEGRRGREFEWSIVKGVFEAVLEGVRNRAVRPKWVEFKTWAKDAKDDFRAYRRTTLQVDCLNAFYILRDSMLDRLVRLALEQVHSEPDSEDSYEDLEATLFILYTIQEGVTRDSASQLSQLFNPSFLSLLPTLNHITLRSSALRVIGEYSTWFASEDQYRESECISAVTFVVAALEEPALAEDAARSLRKLCDHNRKNLKSHVASFVAVLGKLEGRIEGEKLSKVLQSVASVVQALSEDQIIEPILGLTNPITFKLLSSLSVQPSPESRESTLQQLDFLTSCAKGLSDPDDDLVDLDESFDDAQKVKDALIRIQSDSRIAQMRTELGRAIQLCATTWSNDAEIVQALSDFIRQSTSDAVPSPLALDTFELLGLATSALRNSSSPVWLSISTSLLARLARSRTDNQLTDEELQSLAKPLESALSTVLTSLSSPSAMSENPDIVSSFLSFASSIIRHFPRVFILLPHHLSSIIQFAIQGLSLQERFSLKATIDLLISIVQQTRMASTSSEMFVRVLEPNLASLLRSLIESIAGKVPRSQLVGLSEVLHAILLRTGDGSRLLLHESLQLDGWPNERADRTTKEKFEKALRSARTGKQARTAVNDFAMVCRGLDGTDYGSQSANAFEL